jgi:cyclopropane fatty-acyl-phospholipid synthase-like methyltransferase
MFSEKDISDYYQHTRVHYNRFWKLQEAKSINYGLWQTGTKNLTDAFKNINDQVIVLAGINEQHQVLDAGCGIGGSSTYIAAHTKCKVVGITLNAQQKLDAEKNALSRQVGDQCSFYVMNYCQTTFEAASFDTIFAIESSCHATEKKDFLAEAFRLLKPGGRLVVMDYFKEPELNQKQHHFLQIWLHAWAIKDIDSIGDFCRKANEVGFTAVEPTLRTAEIRRSSWLIYFYSILGTIPSKLYGLYNRNATHFGKTHTKAGIVQYQALKQKLWNYYSVVLTK